MRIRLRAMHAILGTFVADAAAAGLHWIYDVDEVRRRGGAKPEFQPPAANQYHAKRQTGEFTHYGDHALVVLESLVECGDFDPDDYRKRLIARFGAADYGGYLDHATKDLLATGKGSDDNQAGCLVKLPAMVARYLEDPELEERVEAAVRVTHDNAQAVRYCRAAAAAIRTAILGANAQGAVAAVVERRTARGSTAALAEKALDAPDETVAFALEMGQNCPVPNAMPVALHASLHGPDFKTVVRNSILSGGDSAGRLFLAAAIRGATDGVPQDWLEKVVGHRRIQELTERLLEQAGP